MDEGWYGSLEFWRVSTSQLSLEYAIRHGIKVDDASFSRNFHRFQVSSRQRHLQDGNLAHATLDSDGCRKCIFGWIPSRLGPRRVPDPLRPRHNPHARCICHHLHRSPIPAHRLASNFQYHQLYIHWTTISVSQRPPDHCNGGPTSDRDPGMTQNLEAAQWFPP